MIYELRQYKAHTGKRDEFVELMDTVVLPFQVESGVDVIGSFADANDPDAYICIRRFQSVEHREQITTAMYGSDRWKNELLPKVAALLNREVTTSTIMEPTPGSALH